MAYLTQFPPTPELVRHTRGIDPVGEPAFWVMGAPDPALGDPSRRAEEYGMAAGLAPLVSFPRSGPEWGIWLSNDAALALAILGEGAQEFPEGRATDWLEVPAGGDASMPFSVAAAKHLGQPLWLFETSGASHAVRVDSTGPDLQATFLPHVLVYDEATRLASSIDVDSGARTIRLVVNGKNVPTETVRPENGRRIAVLLALASDPRFNLDGGATMLNDRDILEVHALPGDGRRLVIHTRNRRHELEVGEAEVLDLVRAFDAIGERARPSVFELEVIRQLWP